MNDDKRLISTLPDSSSSLKEHLSLSGVGFWPGVVHTLSDLEHLTQSWFGRFHQPATRVDLREQSLDGYTSRVGTAGYLLGHAEGYYRPCVPPPDICVFWCQHAPKTLGGETTFIDGAALYQKLPAALAYRLEEEGVVYEALWSIARWQAEFGVNDSTALKSILDAEPRCNYSLGVNGDLHLFNKVNPIIRESDGNPRFINGLLTHLPDITHPRYKDLAYCKQTNRLHWGRGGELEPATINTIIDAHDAVLQKHRWQDSDLLVLDNHRLLHGREPMAGDSIRAIFSRFGYWE